jgi:hypothetical protein
MSHSCCVLRFIYILCFKIHVAKSHIFCIGSDLIKFIASLGTLEDYFFATVVPPTLF